MKSKCLFGALVVILFSGFSCGFLDGDPEVFLIKDSDSSYHLQWTETLLQQRIVLLHGAEVRPRFYLGVAGTELVADVHFIRALGVSDGDWREGWWYEQDSVTRYRATMNEHGDGGDILDPDGNRAGHWWLEGDTEWVTLYDHRNFIIVDTELGKWVDVLSEEDWREDGAWSILFDEDYSLVVVDKAGNRVSGFSVSDLVIMKQDVVNTDQELFIFPAGSFRSDVFKMDYRYFGELSLGSGSFMFEVEVLPAEARSQVEFPNKAYWAAEAHHVDGEDHIDLLVGHPFQPYDVGEPSKLTFTVERD